MAKKSKAMSDPRSGSKSPSEREGGDAQLTGAVGWRLDPGSQPLMGKCAVVTGGTTGIGRATAILLASRGVKVLTYGRKHSDVDRVVREMRDAGGEGFGIAADQSSERDVQRIFKEADKRLGGVDILVNNAAVESVGITKGEYDGWKYTLDTNLLGYLACCREAIDRMKQRGGGDIVNVGSMSADARETGHDAYVASKAGIQAVSESLRKEVNPMGIRVTLIEPGAIGTPLQELTKEQQRKKEKEKSMIYPGDVAECVYFCLAQPKRVDIVSLQVRPLMQLI